MVENRAEILKRTENYYSGKGLEGNILQGSMLQSAAFATELRGTRDRQAYREAYLSGLSSGLELSEQEIELFRRRYTGQQASVNLQNLGNEVDTQMQTRADDGPVQYEGQSRIDKKKSKSRYKKEEKSGYKAAKLTATSRFVKADELQSHWMHEHVLDKKVTLPAGEEAGSKEETVTQQQLLKRVLEGDYSNLQQLDPVLRSVAAGKYMERLRLTGIGDGTPEALVSALYKESGVSGLMNPLFRIGVSILMQGGGRNLQIINSDQTEFWRKVEDLCNQRIMSATICAAPEAGAEIKQDDIERNRKSQIFMAKTLLAAHLGKLQKVQTKEIMGAEMKFSEDWSGGVATAFAHCSRVAFTLPGHTQTMESMIGKNQGLDGGFEKRSAATHKLSRKLRSGDGPGLVEKKSKGTFYGQRGMNVAVGGLGNEGIPGRTHAPRTLKNDGSCGHIYMHVSEGNDEKFTGLLIGFESDSPGHVNMTGHTHDWRAKPEFASSFGGQRCDEIGDKYGGRTVDLTGIDEADFEDYMQRLEDFMNQKMDIAANRDLNKDIRQQAQADLMYLADRLSGELMSREEIDRLLGRS